MEESSEVVCYEVYYNSPCHHFLKEAVNSVLKCLGFVLQDNNNSPHKHNKEQQQHQSSSSSSSDGDPPSTIQPDPPPTDPPPLEDLAGRGRRPPRPPVSGGPDPQTNSNPSSELVLPSIA